MRTLRRIAFATVVCHLLAAASAFAADTFVVDPAHTSVIFRISHMGFSYTYGRFDEMSGGYVLDRENLTASQFQFSINAASVDTNNQKRDDHLRSPDFLNVKQFPAITFKSTAVAVEETEKGTTYNITGNLTMHGVTRQVTLPLRLLKEGPSMGGQVRSGFFCETALQRSEFGMTNMIPAVGDDVAITFSFEGVRQDGAAPE